MSSISGVASAPITDAVARPKPQPTPNPRPGPAPNPTPTPHFDTYA